MSTLTEYRKPQPRYGMADAGWYPKTGWELVDGRWQRLWKVRMGLHLRRALVWRTGGGWTWNVSERDTRGNWTVIAREGNHEGIPYLVAQAAWPFADLAARTGSAARRAQRRTS